MNIQEYLREGIGRRLIYLGRAANMISVSLSPTAACPYEYAIHISASSEIRFEGRRLTCTAEIDEAVSPRRSTYDEKVSMLRQSGVDFTLQSISYDLSGRLTMKFDHALEIRSLPEPDEADDGDELWRIFLHWKAGPHLIATKKGVYLEDFPCTQEEIDRMRERSERRRHKAIENQSVNQGTVL